MTAAPWSVRDLIPVADLLGLATTEAHPRPRRRDDLTFDLAGTAAGEIRWITSLDGRRLWEQFVGLVKEAGQTRTTR